MIGTRADRLNSLNAGVAMMRQDLDVLEARASTGNRAPGPRVARIEAPVAAGYNTFNITFVDGDYEQSAGNRTPDYDDRNPGVAHNLGDAEMSVGDIITVHPWSDRWWFRRGSSDPSTIPESVSFSWATGTNIVTGSGNACGQVVLFTGGPARRSAFIEFNSVPFASVTSAIISIGANNWNHPLVGTFPQGTPIPDGSYTARGLIAGLDDDNGQSTGDLDADPRTTANLAWDYTATVTAGVPTPELPSGSPISYDVTTIVAEIFARPGWASGNKLRLYFDENGSDFSNSPNLGAWQVHDPFTLTIVP